MSLQYWKSLEELAENPQTLDRISKEFPGYNPDEVVSFSRRRFMKLMGASMALAGLTLNGCRRWPKENLAPYSSSPRERIPGIPEQYATVYDLGGVGHGLLVTAYDGRPIKIEGNPSHPFSQTFNGRLGSADAFAQASVLELYDPDRSRSIINRTGKDQHETAATWEVFVESISVLLADAKTAGGKGLAVLSEYSSSPSVAALRDRFVATYPQAIWAEYEPISRENESQGARLAFGRPIRSRLHLDKADTLVLLDADLLGTHPAHTRYANDWSKRRRIATADAGMNRVYLAESRLSITGAVADVRLGVRPSRIALLASALAAKLGVAGASQVATLTPEETRFIDSAAADLAKSGLVCVGETAAAEVHALVHAINAKIGAVGNTITLLEEPDYRHASIVELTNQIKSGGVSALFILGGNPAYDAPADLDFASALKSVPTSVHLSLYDDETSELCKWHVNRAHYLECWSDARAWDGTVSIQQPLILPLFNGKSNVEMLATLCGDNVVDAAAIVRKTVTGISKDNSDKGYRRVMHDGIVPNSAFAAFTGAPRAPTAGISAPAGSELEVCFIPDTKLYDGRFANSGWLQELPDSLSKLVWDNAALLSKKDADTLGVGNGDMLKITVGDRTLQIAAFILPGQPLGVVGIPLGYGRRRSGNIGTGLGFDSYAIRTTGAGMNAVSTNVTVIKTGSSYPLVATQEHHLMDPVGFAGREERVGKKHESGAIIREATLVEFKKDKNFARAGESRSQSLQIFNSPNSFREQAAWGMSVDMSACIGCNACVVACQSENNIPVVGKENVAVNREMHWIRIDRYFKGTADDPQPDVVFQPMMCVHCENAPCEQVCPVAATVHDTEGLNVMVYNRCIGTRYCSNNCPYKVRRFNYFDWHSKDPRGGRFMLPWLNIPDTQQKESIDKIKQMVFNPEVTVRMRGVMEKCTYCVQRIHNTQTAKRNHDQEIADFDIVTACQQACPTEAIVFGNLNDPNATVTQLQKTARAYSVLEDLNTRPRTKHLAKLRNPSEAAAAEAT